jgi:glycosyltransferase involved in cell wall biosynthesis
MSDCPELMTHWPTRYIAVSQAVVRALESRCGIAADRIALVHAFIPERYLDGAGGVDDPPGDGRLTVGGAGVPRWAKGTTLWLQMVAEVQRLAGSAIRFVWVGVPQEPPGYQFRAEARLLGLDGMIEFIPPSPAPLEHFARFDIFTMTSWEDPCPLVVLENMALGKPVICFAGGGGAPEEVGDSGVIVDGFCPREMARRVVELAGAPQERARLGALARERVRAHFTDRVQVPKIQHELEAVLRRGVS